MKKNNNLAADLVRGIRQVAGSQSDFVPLHVPEFYGRERELVLDCIDTGWVSSVGRYVDEFEEKVAGFVGCAHGVAVSNGTSALHIALMVAGVTSDDEVLVPTLTFVATANAVSYLGATPHFVDSAYDTLGVCPSSLRCHLRRIAEVRNGQTWNRKTGRRIAAIVPMHVFGCPIDMDGLNTLLEDWPMVVVEDAAESLGSRYKGRSCGSLGKVAAISFNGNKIITTGGGGAIVTNDLVLAKRAKHLSTTAKRAHKWDFVHDEIGYNYRMPNINAALGVAQLEQVGQRLKHKQMLFDKYSKAFRELVGATLFSPPPFSQSNHWLITLVLGSCYAEDQHKVLQTLNDAGIMARPVWTPMHLLPMYRSEPRADLAQAEDLALRIINIPSSAYLGVQEILEE